MLLTGDLLRGHTDMILLGILSKRDSYGYEINKQLEEVSNGAFVLTEATLYTSFKRLEGKGQVASYWQKGASGKKRKYYGITTLGKEELKNLQNSWQEAKKIIDSLI